MFLIVGGMVVYNQFSSSDRFYKFWQYFALSIVQHPFTLLIVALLMPLNWYLEVMKWGVFFDTRHGMKATLPAVLAGLGLSVVVPYRMGSFVGRAMFYPIQNQPWVAVTSVTSNVIQSIVTQVFGIAAILGLSLFIGNSQLTNLIWLFPMVVVLILLMGNRRWLVVQLGVIFGKRAVVSFLQIPSKRIVLAGGIAVFRYAVFTLQFVLLLYVFNGALPHILLTVCVAISIFWIQSVLPVLPMLDMGIRGAAGIVVMNAVGGNADAALSASTLLWGVNLIFPAMMGWGVLVIKFGWSNLFSWRQRLSST